MGKKKYDISLMRPYTCKRLDPLSSFRWPKKVVNMFFLNSNSLVANRRKSRFGIKQTHFTPCTCVGGGLAKCVRTNRVGGQPNAYVYVREGGRG